MGNGSFGDARMGQWVNGSLSRTWSQTTTPPFPFPPACGWCGPQLGLPGAARLERGETFWGVFLPSRRRRPRAQKKSARISGKRPHEQEHPPHFRRNPKNLKIEQDSPSFRRIFPKLGGGVLQRTGVYKWNMIQPLFAHANFTVMAAKSLSAIWN